MEELNLYPTKLELKGNIIGDKIGFVESLNPFESYRSTVTNANPNGDIEVNETTRLFGITLNKEDTISNNFTSGMQYCSQDNFGANVFLCDQLISGISNEQILYNPNFQVDNIFEIKNMGYGYLFTLKQEYLDDSGVNPNQPYWLLLHDNREGVSIPSTAKHVCFSCEYLSIMDTDQFVSVNFVFIDKDHNVLSTSNPVQLMNNIDGESFRPNIYEPIPNNAKYVSVEFQLPPNLAADSSIMIMKNCLLFDFNYAGFVRTIIEEE